MTTITSILSNRRPGYKLTMSDVRTYNAANGGVFFSRDTMRFFASRIESSLLNGLYFITSEKRCFTDYRRVYSIRRVNDNFSIENIHHAKYDNIEDARAGVRALQAAGGAK